MIADVSVSIAWGSRTELCGEDSFTEKFADADRDARQGTVADDVACNGDG